MTSSVPAVFDQLLALGTAATFGLPGAVIADGWSDDISGTMFGVGSETPPFLEGGQATNVDGVANRMAMGALDALEDYTIPGYIYIGQGGVDNSAVRADAFAVWDAFFDLFNADPTLGGALNDYANLARFSATGPRSAEEAQGGRYCLIQFWIRCQHQII